MFSFKNSNEGVSVCSSGGTVSTNYRVFAYAQTMTDKAVELATKPGDRFLVLGHGMGMMTGNLIGKLIAKRPNKLDFLVKAVELDPGMIKNSIDLSMFQNNFCLLNQNAIDYVETCKYTYDAVLYDLFLDTLDMVFPEIEWWQKLFNVSNTVVINCIRKHDLFRIMHYAYALDVKYMIVTAETFGFYSKDPDMEISFTSGNKVISLIKESSETYPRLLGPSSSVFDFSTKCFHSRERSAWFKNMTLEYKPIREIIGGRHDLPTT